MTAGLTVSALCLLAFCILAETIQQLSFKRGADQLSEDHGLLAGIARQPLIWAGVGIWFIESIAWVMVLQRAPLSLAYPVMTSSYAAVPLAGMLVLKERLSARQVAGLLLICSGVACIIVSGRGA